MLLTLNADAKVGLALIIIAAIGLIFWFVSRGRMEYELTEEGLQQVSEYRTFMVNQWVNLLLFWLNIKPEDAQTKFMMPGANQNSLYFFYKNIEVYAIFDWEKCLMEVKTSVFKEEGGYIKHIKHFSIADGSFPTDKLFNFVMQAQIEHEGEYELTEADVIEVTRQLKDIDKKISPEEAKNRFYDHMADLMILMRKKKNRKNKQLLETYFGLVFYLWTEHKDDFLKFLEIEEEEKNTENIEGKE